MVKLQTRVPSPVTDHRSQPESQSLLPFVCTCCQLLYEWSLNRCSHSSDLNAAVLPFLFHRDESRGGKLQTD